MDDSNVTMSGLKEGGKITCSDFNILGRFSNEYIPNQWKAEILSALQPFISLLQDSCSQLVCVMTSNRSFNWPLSFREEKALGQVGHIIKGGQVKSACR